MREESSKLNTALNLTVSVHRKIYKLRYKLESNV